MFAKEGSFSHFEWGLKQQDRDTEIERFLAAAVATIKHRKRILRKGARLFRAQRGYILKSEEDIGTEIPDAFMPERMRPLRDKASEGRVNRKDKPCLYLAEHKDTAMAEVRPWIGAYVTLAVFEVVRDCALVDCSQDKLTTLDLLMREEEATILRRDLPSGAREVESEGRHVAAEILHLENQLLGQVLGFAPNRPPTAQRCQSVLVAGDIDRFHSRKAEIPDNLLMDKGRDEAAAGRVHVA